MTTQEKYTTTKKKFQHLQPYERGAIQALHKEKRGVNYIAAQLNRSPSTISREIKRGTVQQMRSDLSTYEDYYAYTGECVYKNNRSHCGAKTKIMQADKFLKHAETMIIEQKWSPDAVFGRSMLEGKFDRNKMVCAKTLYNYIDAQLLKVRNHHLSTKLRRKPKKEYSRKHKRLYGRSIEERPAEIESRNEFGHWEIDTVIGKRSKDSVLLTLTERKTRSEIIIPLEEKTSAMINKAICDLQKDFGHLFFKVFRSITADNGSEFAELPNAVNSISWFIYYAHPYSSFERGSNERHNGLIRRFIHKGKAISCFSIEQIKKVNTWCNNLPRKILGYKTPNERFNEEIQAIMLC